MAATEMNVIKKEKATHPYVFGGYWRPTANSREYLGGGFSKSVPKLIYIPNYARFQSKIFSTSVHVSSSFLWTKRNMSHFCEYLYRIRVQELKCDFLRTPRLDLEIKCTHRPHAKVDNSFTKKSSKRHTHTYPQRRACQCHPGTPWKGLTPFLKCSVRNLNKKKELIGKLQ